MKIALFGATGNIGRAVLNEALTRGHDVTAIVRDPKRLDLQHPHLYVAMGDVAEPARWEPLVTGSDAVIASLSARHAGNEVHLLATYAGKLLEHLPATGVKRLLWVGGAGSLVTASGVLVADMPDFPKAWKAEAEGQANALAAFRASHADIDWLYISPAALLEGNERTGVYRLGGDNLLVDSKGVSRISVPDFAAALVDRAEKADRFRRRITVAY